MRRGSFRVTVWLVPGSAGSELFMHSFALTHSVFAEHSLSVAPLYDSPLQLKYYYNSKLYQFLKKITCFVRWNSRTVKGSVPRVASSMPLPAHTRPPPKDSC